MDVKKAYEITDAKIQFVSLVDKAANLKSFLITKSKDGEATFSTYGRIVRKDAEHHFVTGIVYEPLAEDAHGNFMTEEEITKAAYYFAKSGSKVDLQHSFEALPDAAVVESWIAKADFQIGDETVKKGTWLMTVELADQQIWDAIEKGEITGFSMGGVGKYSEEDVDLENVEKTVTGSGVEPEQQEKRGLFKKLAAMFGMEVVEKGEFSDEYNRKMRSDAFYTAFWTLQDILCHYDGYTGKEWLEEDAEKVKEALQEFSKVVQEVLTSGDGVSKALMPPQTVTKAGKKMSSANLSTLKGIQETLGTFIAQFDEPEDEPDEDDEAEKQGGEKDPDPDEDNNKDKEETDVTKAEVEAMVQETVAKAVSEALEQTEPQDTPEAEPVTKEMVQEMVSKAVSDAIAPVLKARGVPTAMNDGADNKDVEKSEVHYLHGIL